MYTIEDLRQMSIDKRRQLYSNALERREKGGQAVLDLIEASGLPLRSTEGLTKDDPIILQIEDLIWSERGRRAAIEATESGLPALSGVDPLLQDVLGANYGAHNLSTASAGAIVASLMRHLGYKEIGAGACSPQCIAKTGMRWTR